MAGEELLGGVRGEGDGDGPRHHVLTQAGYVHGDVGGDFRLAMRGVADPELKEVPWGEICR